MTPDLPNLVAVFAAAGTSSGGVVGFLARSSTPRRMAENVALGGAVGGVAGTALAFTVWVGLLLGGA